MSKLTSIVLAKNEETHLGGCLDSLRWCQQVVVLDSLSTDRTVEIACQHGAEVAKRSFDNFAEQRNAAIELVTSEWVLFVDADERVSSQLAAEIQEAVENPGCDGYWIPTHNYQLGRLVLHAGLYPDYHLRLFRKAKGRYDPAQKVHERVLLDGAEGHLKNPLIHISCENWAEFINHQRHYASLKAQVHFERGVKPSYHFVAGPVLEFLRRYVILQGFRDGGHGLYLSLVFAYYTFVTYLHLAHLWKNRFDSTGG